MESKVLGLGNALVDILARIPNNDILARLSLPRGSMQLVDDKRSAEIQNLIRDMNPVRVSGGSTCNTIHGLANLGISTGLAGKIGSDDLGEFFKADMLKSGRTCSRATAAPAAASRSSAPTRSGPWPPAWARPWS